MKISLSILDFDFAKLNEELTPLYPYIDYLHLDIMDGVFVPNISFGIPIIKSLRKYSDILFDTHLMIVEPEKYIESFAECGSNLITFHLEATKKVKENIHLIKSLGLKCGISINPSTKLDLLLPYLKDLDLVLIMGVNPGFGGQSFMNEVLEKMAKLKQLQDKYHYEIFVDGGINLKTISHVSNLCDTVILGSAVKKAENKIELLKQIKSTF